METKINPADLQFRVQQTSCNTLNKRLPTNITVEFYFKPENPSEAYRENIVGRVILQRIPSDVCPCHLDVFGAGYDMAAMMCNESQALGHVVKDLMDYTSTVSRNALGKLQGCDLFYIKKVWVAPEYRRLGIGTYMMKMLYSIIRLNVYYTGVLLCLRTCPDKEPFEDKWCYDQPALTQWFTWLGFKSVNDNSSTMFYDC